METYLQTTAMRAVVGNSPGHIRYAETSATFAEAVGIYCSVWILMNSKIQNLYK